MYDSVADLPLVVDSVTTERRERDTSSGFVRATTVITLAGEGERGRGEDVTYTAEAHDPDRWADLSMDLTGEYTLDAFSSLLADTDLFSEGPERDVFENYRRWGFESAALDLALRQADTTLSARLDRQVDPVSFVVSTRLSDAESDEPPTADRIHRWLDVDPALTFKTDPTPDWPGEVIDELAATDAIRILDFKGHYEGTEVENPADPDLYERLLTTFPDAVVEDPDLTEETRALFDGAESRVSWDAPIHGIDDIEALPFEPSWLNIKPSRFGSVESLLDTIDYCAERNIQLYGGGQFELDVGRRHIQLLASLFYPDGPNDVAPPAYNDPEPSPDVPSSPLAVSEVDAGFGWE
ncbi:hypothetical protein [Salinibaculum rarum]|uniref:hypothetical protein n=1 Tax=Salinibaculum rarum TaxID=3058903 RepID=UPI00265E1B89|nr:hypothetical protein [Salinibaculum sp. KK48]